MTKRKALGKGLGALIRNVPSGEKGEKRLLEIDISRIKRNPDQPRSHFDQDALDELATSIKNQGLLQPIVLRKEGAGYQIVVGERRWRAAQQAGLKKVPAIIHDVDDQQLLEAALVENIQREDLNPIEEAKAYQLLIDRLGITQEKVAERVGKSRTAITNTLRLLKLHDDVKKHLVEGSIEMGHARALLPLGDQIAQKEVCRDVISKGMTVRQVEKLVREIQGGLRKPKKQPVKKDPFIRDAEDRLASALQSRVSIKPARKGGKIEIRYASEKDLQRLFDQLT